MFFEYVFLNMACPNPSLSLDEELVEWLNENYIRLGYDSRSEMVRDVLYDYQETVEKVDNQLR